MDINRMREFSYLADTLSFSTTAKHFYLSQSVLSKHIASMEDELSAKLFVRDSHHVRLTEQGLSFKRDVGAIIGSYERAVLNIASINDDFTSTVSVGYLRNATRPFITRFCKAMARRHPEVNVNLRCFEYGDLLYASSVGSVDVAVSMRLDPSIDDRYEHVAVYRDRFDAVVSHAHPLAAFDEITSDQLSGHALLLPDDMVYAGMYDFVKNLLPDDFANGRNALYRDVDTLFLKVQAEDYVGFSSEHNKPQFSKDVKFLPIADRASEYDVCAFVRAGEHTDATRACFDAFWECARELERAGGISAYGAD